ncbi:MAG TPA: DNA-directed RNA polymerase subunit alpha C-terminal domain-containing protein [Phycisphaerae bacterium]|nr:DNA-directed RNA polymerase subunit alpha C-terminal domain-containing protein [Phycisphaerae bacterium]
MAKSMSEIEKACVQGHSDEAERLLGETPPEETGTAAYHYHLGWVRETQGRYEDALDAYERALQLEPAHRPTLFRLAYLYDLRGEENLAIDYYKQCIQQPPVHEGALINLGVLYEDASRYDEAIECFARVLKARPNHQRARLFLADAKASHTMFYDEESERRRDKRNQVLEIPVTDFELSVRSRNCLRKMNIRNLGDLIQHTEPELLSYKNFGETSLQEIKDMLASKNLSLGMTVEGQGQRLIPSPAASLVMPSVAARSSGDAVAVADLELSARSRKALERLGIATLGDLMNLTEEKLLACKNFGETSLNEIKQVLNRYGLALGG